MKTWLTAIFIVLLATAASSVALQSNPATEPAAPQLTELQQNLLLQLSDAEANIQAINKALTRAGYSVGLAYNQIDSNLKGNDAMNRNGGGPVRWDAFYGKTARDFVMHDRGSPVYHQVQRPSQFDYIYKANNDQVERAKEQISNLAQDQTALLERRRKHEADQSRLWATLSWQEVKDREIGFHAISRFALTPQNSDAAVLRPLVLFLRTADRVAQDSIESVNGDQLATFQAGGQRMEAAFNALQLSLIDAMDDAKLPADHLKTAQALKSQCKVLSEECKVIALNYVNALDRDQAKQDASKLTFRAQLQTSLAKFAAITNQLDDEVTSTAKEWGVTPDRSTPTPDQVPAAPAPVNKPTGAAAVANNAPAAADNAANRLPTQAGQVDLLKLVNLKRDAEGRWSVNKDGSLSCSQSRHAKLEFPYTPSGEYDFETTFKRTSGEGALMFFCMSGSHPFGWGIAVQRNRVAGLTQVDGQGIGANSTTKHARRWIAPNETYTQVIKVRANGVEVYLNDKLVSSLKTDFSNVALGGDKPRSETHLSVDFLSSDVDLISARVMEMGNAVSR